MQLNTDDELTFSCSVLFIRIFLAGLRQNAK